MGIADSRSGFNNCHRHLPELVEAVKRGVTAAGGLALDFPTISLGEVFLEPTSMLYRNLMSMDVEEMVRAQPMDAVVLVGGCDKTIPAQLMGAASAGVPAIQVPAGPMMTGRWQGERLGRLHGLPPLLGPLSRRPALAGADRRVEGRLATTAGTCAVMGTASTMACRRRGPRHDGRRARPPCPPCTPIASGWPRRRGQPRWPSARPARVPSGS